MKIILRIFAQAGAVWLCGYFLPGFTFTLTGSPDTLQFWLTLFGIGLVLFVINSAIRPILKVLLFPAILLSFGLVSSIITLGLLKIYDIVIPEVTIEGFWTLVWASIIIGLTNTVFEWLTEE